MNSFNNASVAQTAIALFATSRSIFWSALPVALLLSLLIMYLSGQISGAKVESILRRLVIAILLLVAFPEISAALTNLDRSLVDAFGGDQSLTSVFSKVSDQVRTVKDAGILHWASIGSMGLSVITTISYVLLAFVQKFLLLLRLLIWNLLHILGPIALLGCLFPSLEVVPKGIFIGLLEISLWRPLWVILCRLLMAIGFGDPPGGISDWLDLAILNFAVAALMASTPSLVHGFLSGSLAGVGGSAVQSMIGGVGAMLAGAPGLVAKKAFDAAQNHVVKPVIRQGIKKPSVRTMKFVKSKFTRKQSPKPKSTQKPSKEDG